MNELFKMNEYGDIWQEPTLFDQGEEVAPRPAWLRPDAIDSFAPVSRHEHDTQREWIL